MKNKRHVKEKWSINLFKENAADRNESILSKRKRLYFSLDRNKKTNRRDFLCRKMKFKIFHSKILLRDNIEKRARRRQICAHICSTRRVRVRTDREILRLGYDTRMCSCTIPRVVCLRTGTLPQPEQERSSALRTERNRITWERFVLFRLLRDDNFPITCFIRFFFHDFFKRIFSVFFFFYRKNRAQTLSVSYKNSRCKFAADIHIINVSLLSQSRKKKNGHVPRLTRSRAKNTGRLQKITPRESLKISN